MAVLGGLLAGLLLVEVGLRIVPRTQDKSLVRYEPRPGDEGQSPLPDQRVRTLLGVPETVNAHGLRDPERSLERADSAVARVALVGDSVVWGFGVRDEQIPARLLERRLAEERPEVAWEVWSLAQPATTQVNHAARFARLGPGVDPDVTVLFFLFNDLLEGATRFRVTEQGYLARRHRKAPYPDFIRPVLDRSVVFHWMMLHWYAREVRKEHLGHAFRLVHLPEQLGAAQRLLDAARQGGSEVVLVLAPGTYEPPDEYAQLGDELARWSAARGVRFVDLSRELGEPLAPEYGLPWDTTHLNEAGNEVLAGVLTQEVLAVMGE